jgi:signal transduction histidine kinase
MVVVATVAGVAVDAVAVALLGWVTWTAVGERARPSAAPFVALVGTMGLWALFSLGSEVPVVSSAPVLSSVWEYGKLGAPIAIPGLWTLYALSYTGRGTGLTRRRVVMLVGIALPLVGTGLLVFSGLPTPVVERAVASLLGTELMYLFVLFAYGTYLLVGHGRGHARVSTWQTAMVTAGVSAPYLVGAAGSGGTPANGVSVGLVVGGALLAVAQRWYPVLTGFPRADHVARTRVVETLREAVVVLDWEGYVLDVNETAAELFDSSASEMIDEPLGSLVAGLDGRDLSVGATGEATLQTTRGRRQFQYSVSAVDADADADGDGGENAVARTLLLRDVTDQRAREQRLTVLHRVLRHNVRNKLDVVLAHADHVDDEDLRAGIRDGATDLVELSNKAREAEALMTTSTESPEPVDLAAVAADVVRERRADHPGEVSLSCPDELTVTTHRRLVRRILAELVDNALTHADGSAPSVEVSLRADAAGGVELTVADDGPGIPERQREILESGTETPLRHGQGIGLWFVNWAVLRLGGDLDLGERESGGSVVTVRLCSAESGP